MSFADDFAALMAEQGIEIDPSVLPDSDTIANSLRNIQIWMSDLNPAVREGFDEGSAEYAICYVLAEPEIGVAPEIQGILQAYDRVSGRPLSELVTASQDCWNQASGGNV